jgi:hypothetical protein
MRLGWETASIPTDADDEMEPDAFSNTPNESRIPRPEDRRLPAVREAKDASETELGN